MKIIIAGSTGLVGSILTNKLIQHHDFQIETLTRKPVSINSPHHNSVIDWDSWGPTQLIGDVFICCLGTTIKAAGSPEQFRKVDFDYVKKFAEVAKNSGAKKFIFISSNGADAKSRVLYTRTKGETEKMLIDLNFESLALLRPSLLIGERSENRPFEKIAQKIMPHLNFILQGSLEKFQTIEAEIVADYIEKLVSKDWIGVHFIESDSIKKGLFK